MRDHTLHAADVRFLIGYCQLHTLHYDDAIKTLETFAKDYPNASERLQATAKQIVQELRRRKANGMSDVADLMAYAGRRLGHGTSNEPVTSKQAKAVALLDDRMIQSIPFTGPLRLTARVDGDGNAMTRDPGDLTGAAAGTHAPGDRGVQVVIDEVL